ncbi:MAG: hypothetical protein A2Z59_10055 [Nitrospinae bacterium RIFCSPLOWO2_02_39_17]|nr:MAG: hypothetical protein A3D20_00205 [Nitrospinae bacterium RIFCSPHIGHO2_02_FULL_39_82]OGW07159.1 MAG: hypothetical protein A2Z59_10055 [Nitrospinae bacterium RIFCSPLOWO2_02_39_17]OGW10668.1 MAG: hypothetical protein A2W75_00880 [Nitrospinae bacterium RIFCSPLOWO2_12_39_15]
MKESSDSPIENNIDILKKGLSLSEDNRLTFLKYLEHTKNSLYLNKFSNLEILSTIMLDYDFNGDVFALDKVFYAENLKKDDYEVRFAEDKVKWQVMAETF